MIANDHENYNDLQTLTMQMPKKSIFSKKKSGSTHFLPSSKITNKLVFIGDFIYLLIFMRFHYQFIIKKLYKFCHSTARLNTIKIFQLALLTFIFISKN